MKFPKYRSVNIELMTELLYWDYKSRFSLYNKLNNELKEKTHQAIYDERR